MTSGEPRPALVAELADALLEAMCRGISVVLLDDSIEVLCVECPQHLTLPRHPQFPSNTARRVELFAQAHRDAWCQRAHDLDEVLRTLFTSGGRA